MVLLSMVDTQLHTCTDGLLAVFKPPSYETLAAGKTHNISAPMENLYSLMQKRNLQLIKLIN